MRLLSLVGVFSVCLASATAQQAPPSPQVPTFRASTRLVPISVVVTDRAGRPIDGLTAADFEIREGGKVQPVSAFAVEQSAVKPPAFIAAAAPNSFTNVLDGRTGGGATIILYDPVNTRDVDQRRALDHILALLAKMRPEERVGFYVLKSDGLLIVHDFTRDTASLVKLLTRYAPATSRELVASEEKIARTAPDPDPAIEARFEEALQRTEQVTQMFHIDRRARITTGALEALTRRLAGVSGRKNVIWVTGSFPLQFGEGVERQTWSQDVYRATRALSHSDIAIYVVHAAGLVAAQQVVHSSAATPTSPTGSVFSTPTHVNAAALDTGHIVAEQTGALVYKNTNDLAGAMKRAIDDANVTYVLGYYPSNDQWDARFRRIQVKVLRRDAIVRHRSGYYAHPPLAVDPDHRKTGLAEAIAYPIEATGVGLAVRADRRENNQVVLTLTVDPQGINLQEKQGRLAGALDIAIAQRMSDNALARNLETTLPLDFTPDVREALQRDGLTLTRTLELQANTRQIVVAVRDVTTGAIGTVIIDTSRLRSP